VETDLVAVLQPAITVVAIIITTAEAAKKNITIKQAIPQILNNLGSVQFEIKKLFS